MDKQFENVILHVVVWGEPNSALLKNSQLVPTIKLGVKGYANNLRSCSNYLEDANKEIFLNWIHFFAAQRWYYLQSYFNQGEEVIISRILSFLDINSNTKLVQQVIEYYFKHCYTKCQISCC